MPRVQARNGSVTVWAAFQAAGKTHLQVLEGNMDQYQYLSILQSHLLPFVRSTFGNNFVYQDFNAPCHHSQRVTKYLAAEEVEHFDWPI